MITLLYVDDEPTLLERTRQYMEQAGYCVDTAGSSGEALQLIRKNSYDVIVSDYLMPETDGIGLLQEIRKIGIRTPFIILIGKNQEDVAVNALRSDADFYLEKRISFWADLPRAIESIRQGPEQQHTPRPAPEMVSRAPSRETPAPPSAAPVPKKTINVPAELQALASSVESLEHAIFGIDREGRVIIWNAAISRITGIEAEMILGRNDFAYSVPFYGKPRPMLVDYILHPGQIIRGSSPPVVRNGDVYMTGTERITLKNKPVLMTGKGTAITDAEGKVLGAIQSIVINDATPGTIPEGLFEEEQYIGGISSGVAVLGEDSTVPGAIRSESWKYGLYATDRRLFVVDDKMEGVTGPVPLPAMPFIVHKIFGGKADVRPRSLEDLVQHKVFEIPRGEIASVRISPQEIAVGCLEIFMKDGGSLRLLVARRQALSHMDWIFQHFYPEIPRTPTTTRHEQDLVWLDELWMRDLVDRLRPEDPLRGIGEPSHTRRRDVVAEPEVPEGEWAALAQFAEKTPLPLFAIDRNGRVIVWNAAITRLTRVPPEQIIGKGGYSHAIPFYGRARPMLVDSLLMHRGGSAGRRRPGVSERAEDTVVGEPEEVLISGKPLRMQERATCIYDENGEITAAIQSVIVSEPKPLAPQPPSVGAAPFSGETTPPGTGMPRQAPSRMVNHNASTLKSSGINTAVRAVTGEYLPGMPPAEKAEDAAEKEKAPQEIPEGRGPLPGEPGILPATAPQPAGVPPAESLANRIIFDAHEGIMAYDRELRITVWNRFMEELTGLDAGSVFGRPVAEAFPVIRDSGGTLLMERALDGQSVESPDLCVRLPASGKQVWVRLICSPLSDAANTVIGGVGIVQDATARKVMECALESTMLQLVDSEEKYRNVFNATNEPLLLIDTVTRQILDFNDAVSGLYGYSRQELLSMSVNDLSAEGRDAVADELRPHMRLCHHRKKDGTVFPADVSTAVFEIKGRSVRILSIRDLSILQQNADALRLANSKLSLMIGITRHDILNKITVLVGFNELLKGMITDPDALEMIKKQGKMMQLVCSQIEFTRDYDNLGAKSPQWQNVQKLVRRTYAQFSGGTVPLHCDTGNLEVFADPLLEKVFYNLFDNAIRYAKGATGIRVFSIMEENGLLLVFEDDGPGIPREDKERIFERGFGRNTGLGLFFVKEILSITDIAISESGDPGRGARFELAIPQGGFRLHAPGA